MALRQSTGFATEASRMVSGLPYKQPHRTYPLLLPADYSFAHPSLRENLEVQMLGGGPKRDKSRWRQNMASTGIENSLRQHEIRATFR